MDSHNYRQYIALRRYVSPVRALALMRHEGLLQRFERAIRKNPERELNYLGRLAVLVA